MKEKNHGFYDADPYFNKNLAQNRDDFSFSAIVTRDFEKVIPKTFHEEVIFEAEFSPISARAVCVFAHYDAGGLIAPYVIYYLTEIKKHMDIVFVSTSEKMSKSELYKIQTLVNIGIIKKNIGYDFGSWKTAIDRIDHDRVDRLVMCNDSVFGPLFDLGHFFVAWEESGANAFGITDSFEIRHHLQSYFVGFDKKTINSASFVGFWAKMKVIELKEELILRNEIGLSEELRKAGLVLDCLAPARKLGYLNNTHLCWKELITEFRSPFVKLELLRDNPLERDLSTFQNVVEHHSDYPCDLIDQQLLRAGIQLDSYLSSGHVEQIKYA
ncbi:MAG: rhamnosyltransferase [Candidatus Azotimanducaceae bacterium]|jgi:rhamnosyltransferase